MKVFVISKESAHYLMCRGTVECFAVYTAARDTFMMSQKVLVKT